MHRQITSQLRVTLNQSHIITPPFQLIQFFDFGFPGFAGYLICHMQNINNNEALVDIFYGIAGCIDVCELPPEHIVRFPDYMNFLCRLLTLCVDFPHFDAQRLVYLIKTI
jgi:hypothetical protein